MTKEICLECDCETGRAGELDDSIYVGGRGPFCEVCERDALAEAHDRLTRELEDVRERCHDQDQALADAVNNIAILTYEVDALKEALEKIANPLVIAGPGRWVIDVAIQALAEVKP